MRIKLPCNRHLRKTFSVLALLFFFGVHAPASLADAEQAIFWAIEKDGKPVGHLLGTVHSEDPRVLEFSEEFLGKLRSNKIFAMELVPDLPTLARLTEYMHLPQGQTLEVMIGVDRFNALIEALAVYKVPRHFVTAMKPWAAMMTLSTPPPETGFFMDLSLSLRASGSGLKVIGLETLEQQLSFLQEMPMDMQLSLLDQAIAEAGHVQQAHDQLLEAYLQNDLNHLQSLSELEFESIGTDERDYFFEKGIVQRNQRMLISLLPYLENSSVFVAVGALHLPGEHGLLQLLRQKGYQLIPQDMPFYSD